MKEFVDIPKERKGALIGKCGKIKMEIENKTKTRITVKDAVEIEGDDPVNLLTAKNIALAIARGFSPEHAFELFDTEKRIEILNLKNWFKTERGIKTQKSRIIGRRGMTRKMIEEKTKCFISVYGKTISIIGKWQDLRLARQCIELLLGGKPQAVVYHMLHDNSREYGKSEIFQT